MLGQRRPEGTTTHILLLLCWGRREGWRNNLDGLGLIKDKERKRQNRAHMVRLRALVGLPALPLSLSCTWLVGCCGVLASPGERPCRRRHSAVSAVCRAAHSVGAHRDSAVSFCSLGPRKRTWHAALQMFHSSLRTPTLCSVLLNDFFSS